MEKKQTILLVGVFIFLFVGMTLLALFLQGTGSGAEKSGGVAKASQKRLQLTSSKPRQALTITSKRSPTLPTSAKSRAEAPASDAAEGGYSGLETTDEREDIPGGAVTRDAMNAASPAQGIAQLDAALEQAPPPIKAAQYHSAKAVLAAQLTPPDLDASQAAFEQALRIAPDLPTELSVRLQQAQLLLTQDAQDRAMAVIEAALAQQGAPSPEGMRLQLLRGTLLEEEDAAKAEAAYAEAIELARTLFPEAPAVSSEMLRVAAFRLARLYRAQGKQEEAETLSRKVRAYLERCMAQKSPGNALPPLVE